MTIGLFVQTMLFITISLWFLFGWLVQNQMLKHPISVFHNEFRTLDNFNITSYLLHWDSVCDFMCSAFTTTTNACNFINDFNFKIFNRIDHSDFVSMIFAFNLLFFPNISQSY